MERCSEAGSGEEEEKKEDRPRKVLCLSNCTKQGAAFQAGAILALARLGLLKQVKVVSSVGLGCVVAAYLMRAWKDHAPRSTIGEEWVEPVWSRLVNTEPLLKHGFVVPLLQWLDTNQEWDAACSRLMNPSRWLNPWQDEFVGTEAFQSGERLDHITQKVDERSTTRNARPPLQWMRPVFLFTAWDKHINKLVLFTNDATPPASRYSSVEALEEKRMDRVLVATSMVDPISSTVLGDRTIQNAGGRDPLATTAAQLYYSVCRVSQEFGSDRSSRSSTRGMSKQVLLIDALSSQEEKSVYCKSQIEMLGSPEDTSNESMRFHENRFVQMFSREYLELDHSDEHGEDLLMALRDNDCEGLDASCGMEHLKTAANWGYMLTLATYGSARTAPCPFKSSVQFIKILYG